LLCLPLFSLTTVSGWLTCLDHTLSFSVFHRSLTLQAERYRVPPPNLDGSPNNMLQYLTKRLQDLQTLVRQGELSQRGRSSSVHVPLHARMCERMLHEFHTLQVEHSIDENICRTIPPPSSSPKPSSCASVTLSTKRSTVHRAMPHPLQL
jgi:hypothetical protein